MRSLCVYTLSVLCLSLSLACCSSCDGKDDDDNTSTVEPVDDTTVDDDNDASGTADDVTANDDNDDTADNDVDDDLTEMPDFIDKDLEWEKIEVQEASFVNEDQQPDQWPYNDENITYVTAKAERFDSGGGLICWLQRRDPADESSYDLAWLRLTASDAYQKINANIGLLCNAYGEYIAFSNRDKIEDNTTIRLLHTGGYLSKPIYTATDKTTNYVDAMNNVYLTHYVGALSPEYRDLTGLFIRERTTSLETEISIQDFFQIENLMLHDDDLLFIGTKTDETFNQLYIYDIKEKEKKQLTNDECQHHFMSVNENKIAYIRMDCFDNPQWVLALYDINTGNIDYPLGQAEGETTLSGAINEKYIIAFHSPEEDDNWYIVLYDLTSGIKRIISPALSEQYVVKPPWGCYALISKTPASTSEVFIWDLCKAGYVDPETYEVIPE